jgi:hypothetical protein
VLVVSWQNDKKIGPGKNRITEGGQMAALFSFLVVMGGIEPPTYGL